MDSRSAENGRLPRREFLRCLGRAAGLVAASTALSCGPWAHRHPRRPNILLIMSDEHDPAVSGCYGDPVARTPHLDALAAAGVLFSDHYTTSPYCVPARMSFTAGKYSSRIGAWNNNSRLPSDDTPSLPSALNAAGYESFLAGKMGLDRDHRYGYTELYSGYYNRDPRTGVDLAREDPEDFTVDETLWNARTRKFRVREDSWLLKEDRRATDEVRAFLSARRPADGPFFLAVGYLAPHFPLIVPEEFHAPFAGRVPDPVIPEGHVESLPTNYQLLLRRTGVASADPEMTRKGRELYWGMVHWLDAQIGSLLETLAASPVGDNTVVVYTSDHGELKGDHGLWWKSTMFEASSRVPLIVRWPERWGGGTTRAGACSLVDLARTLGGIGGAALPDDWDGDSLLEWMDDPASEWKNRALSEYYARYVASGITMFRRGRFKYVYHARMNDTRGPERELYDLEADPGEFDNLAGREDLQGQVESLHQALVVEVGRDPDETELICRREIAAGYGDAAVNRLRRPISDDDPA